MSNSNPLFQSLLSEGWFVSVVGTYEDRVYVDCRMYSRDYDSETGHTDIVLGDPGSEPPDTSGLQCVAKFHGAFELREHGPAALLDQPPLPSGGYKEMPSEMANAIAALITPTVFPEAAEFMPEEPEYQEGEDARSAFWASVNRQVSSMTAAGDPWGALKLQREAVNKLINWVEPPPEDEDDEIPEPKPEDTGPPSCLLEFVYGDDDDEDDEDDEDEDDEEDQYVPAGSHLLPADFRDFLRNWNQTISASTGDWIGEARRSYREQNPELWKQYRAQWKEFNELYPKEVEAVKAYQATYKAEVE
jgi:hypothetical protein